MRTAVLGSRFPAPVVPMTCMNSGLLYHAQTIPMKQQARLTSTTPRGTAKLASQLRPLSKPSLQRTPTIRTNSTSTAPHQQVTKLDWNSFFRLRASRRRYTLASSVVASVASTVGGVQWLATQDLDAISAQVMGLDPFIVLGLATAASGAVGWLVGPFLGNAVWSMVYRRYTASVNVVSSVA